MHPSLIPSCLGVAVTVISSAALAVPPRINVQGVLRDGQGALLEGGAIEVTLRLYADPEGGSLLWSEAQTVDLVGGTFSTFLPLDPATADLSPAAKAAIAAGDDLWLTLTPDGQGELDPVPLVSVPYAMTAGRALIAAELACSGCVGAEQLASGALSAATTTFDDGVAGLGATTLQGAIEALAGLIAQLDAMALPYDPMQSLLAATDVQGALDELAGLITAHIADDDAHGGGSGGGGGGAITVYDSEGHPIGKFLDVDTSVTQTGASRCEGLVYLPTGSRIGDTTSRTLTYADCRTTTSGLYNVYFTDPACASPALSSQGQSFMRIDFPDGPRTYSSGDVVWQWFPGIHNTGQTGPSVGCPTSLLTDTSLGLYRYRYSCQLYRYVPGTGCSPHSLLWYWENGFGTYPSSGQIATATSAPVPICGGAPCYAE